MKISLLSHDVSHNNMARAHLLWRMLRKLQDVDEVEIIGRASNGQVWEPLRRNTDVRIRVMGDGSLAELAERVDGDVLYAIKPRPTSLGVALEARKRRDRPLLVDLDDWETGFLVDDAMAMVRSKFRDETRWVARNVLDVTSANNIYRTALMERRVGRADAVTTTSTWLADRYNGTVIVQARDTDVLDPALVDRTAARIELELPPQATVLLFMGTPRRHKGLGKVLAALDRLRRDDIVFMIVGGDPGLAYRPDVRVMGWQPYDRVTTFLAAADVVVVAQEPTPGARGQMPTKAYDAMAMGRPVIATDVSDLSKTIEGCGLVVPSGDLVSLAHAIETLADDPAMRQRLGRAGRERCVAEYSDDAVSLRLQRVLDSALGRPAADGVTYQRALASEA